jgi:hypothetical protein
LNLNACILLVPFPKSNLAPNLGESVNPSSELSIDANDAVRLPMGERKLRGETDFILGMPSSVLSLESLILPPLDDIILISMVYALNFWANFGELGDARI